MVLFGLKNAPPYFQHRMDEVLRGLPFVRCYIDDIVVWSNNLEEHLQHPEQIFQRLRETGPKVHLGKCVFAADIIDFLGHRISAGKLEPQSEKLAAVRYLPAPIDLSGLRAALGLFSYYRKFVANFNTIAFPLNSLLKKDRPWVWGEACHGCVCGVFGAEGATMWSCHLVAPRCLQPFHFDNGLESARHGSDSEPSGEGWRGAPRLPRITELQSREAKLQLFRGRMPCGGVGHQSF